MIILTEFLDLILGKITEINLSYFSYWWILIAVLAFACEFMDSSLGMGYGTTLTPVLMIIGFDPLLIVPAVLISEFFTGVLSGIFHVLFKNIKLGKTKEQKFHLDNKQVVTKPDSDTMIPRQSSVGGGIGITKEIDEERKSLLEKIKDLTIDTKIIVILSFFGIIGTITSSLLSVILSYSELFKFVVKLYISIMVLSMGIIIIIFRNKEQKFTYKKIIGLGILAGFNKGMSGGGYGPITVSGQILAGRDGKEAIGSTSLSEGIICFAGASTYLLTNLIQSSVAGEGLYLGDLSLFPFLIVGAILSAPLAAITTKLIDNEKLKLGVGITTIVLGTFTLIKTILNYTNIW
jgi:hypothetical protein